MDREVKIPWEWGRNTMSKGSIYHGKGIKIPWGGVSKYHRKVGVYTIGRVVDIPWGGGQNTMGRGSIFHR